MPVPYDPRMVATDTVRRVQGSRPRRRRIGVAFALLVGIVVAAGGIVAVDATTPMAGSAFAPDPVGLLATEAEDPASSEEPRPIYVYRYAPGATFLTMTSIRNDGPLALTLLGPEPPPPDIETTTLPWADRLLLSSWPDVVGPDEALPVDSIVIDAGQEVGVWIVWRVGARCPLGEPPPLMAGSGYEWDSLDLRWSVLGIPRSAPLELRHVVEVRDPADDPLVTCLG